MEGLENLSLKYLKRPLIEIFRKKSALWLYHFNLLNPHKNERNTFYLLFFLMEGIRKGTFNVNTGI